MIPIYEIFQNIVIIQIGCGGTGGWLVPHLSKFLNNMLDRSEPNFKNLPRIKYLLVDHDEIEVRNVLRQNFQEFEQSQNKAKSLAMRYCESTLQIQYSIQPFFDHNIKVIENLRDVFVETEYGKKSMVIFIGCVDHIDTRYAIYKLFKKIEDKYFHHLKCVYIDSGNDLHHGQLYTYWAKNFPEEIKNSKKGHKGFMNSYKKMKFAEGEEVETRSCAFFGEQTQSLNNLAASLLFCQVQNLLINCELPPPLITFNGMGYSTYKM
jgi:hypothetical protein